MSADLAATVAALRDGDRVRATFVYGDTKAVIEGPVCVDDGNVWVRASGDYLTYNNGTVKSYLTAVEVLAPALPPEPALRSIVTDRIGDAWQSYLSEAGSFVWASTSEEFRSWTELLTLGPITLIYDAGGES